MSHGLFTRVRLGLLILVAILAVGTAGYALFEGWSPLQSFFSSILVISTLGLLRAPETPAGVALTMTLIFTGVGTVAYLLTQVAETIIETSLGADQERRMKRQIAGLKGHTIVCGFGRVGRHAAAELAEEKRPFVVIDSDHDGVERARASGFSAILGDATEDYILKAAGVERAAALLIATASDAVNVFITLTARAFNPNLLIVARASEDSSEAKLEKAGADRVIAPETIGGRRMAALTCRPEATAIMDSLIGAQDDEGWLDQTTVEPGSSLAGRRIGEAHVYSETGATIIAIRRRDGQTILNPSADEYMREGDVIISVGAREELEQLEGMAHIDNARGRQQ